MKHIWIFSVFILIQTFVIAQQDTSKPQWLTDFAIAKDLSSKTSKPIIMYFTGSDWCVPCIMLREDFFDTDRFHKIAKDLVLIKVDIPRRVDIISENQLKANKELLKVYNKEGGFPLLVALNAKGKVLDSESSYSTSLRDPSRYFNFVENLAETTEKR